MSVISNLWILVGIFVMVTIANLFFTAYKLKLLPLLIMVIGSVIFIVRLLLFIGSIENDIVDVPVLLSLIICMIICIVYIYLGGRKGSVLTETIVISELSGRPVGTVKQRIAWVDPLFTQMGTTLDLRRIPLVMPTTPTLITLKKIKAWIRDIRIMIKRDNDQEGAKILTIEGGLETIKAEIMRCTDEFFIHKVGTLEPSALDSDKGTTIHDMEHELSERINRFCESQNYPYIVLNITIGDTELDPAYYEALALKVIEALKQEAKDIAADALKKRVKSVGEYVMPSGSESEQLQAAEVILEIVKKTIDKKQFSFDGDLSKLVKEVAKILKTR